MAVWEAPALRSSDSRDGIKHNRVLYATHNPQVLSLQGREVVIRMDPNRADYLIVCSLDGVPICYAASDSLEGHTQERIPASVKTCQELARHSDPLLTIGRYSYVRLCLTGALNSVPIPGGVSEVEPAKTVADGTYGDSPEQVAAQTRRVIAGTLPSQLHKEVIIPLPPKSRQPGHDSVSFPTTPCSESPVPGESTDSDKPLENQPIAASCDSIQLEAYSERIKQAPAGGTGAVGEPSQGLALFRPGYAGTHWWAASPCG